MLAGLSPTSPTAALREFKLLLIVASLLVLWSCSDPMKSLVWYVDDSNYILIRVHQLCNIR